MHVASLSHHLRVLVELIQCEAAVLHVVRVRSRAIEGRSLHVRLIDREVLPGSLRNQRGIHELEVLLRAFIQVDGVRRIAEDLLLLEVRLREKHLIDFEQGALVVNE